jgi:hypothetical protein
MQIKIEVGQNGNRTSQEKQKERRVAFQQEVGIR